MKVKKILAALLSLAMFIGVLPFTAFADGKTMKFELVYMTQSGGNYVEGTVPGSSAKDSEFFVGVKVTGLSTIEGAADGLYSMGVGVVYNPTYLTLEPDVTHNSSGGISDSNLKSAVWPRVSTQSFIEPNEYDYDLTKDKETTDEVSVPGDTRTVIVNLMTNKGASVFTGDTPFYQAIYKFKVKEVPAGGQQVLGFANIAGNLDFGLGEFGGSGSFACGTGDETDILGLAEFDTTKVDIFPSLGALNSIAVTAGAPNLGDKYYVRTVTGAKNSVVDLTGVKLTLTHAGGTVPNVTPDKYYYGNAGATDVTGLTEITNGRLTVDNVNLNGKTLYVAVTRDGVTKLAALTGTLQVENDAIKTLGAGTGNNLKTGYKIGDTIDLSGLKTLVEYNSGDRYSAVAVADLDKYGLKVVDGNGAALKTTALALTDKGTHIVVQNADGSKKWDATGANGIDVADATYSLKSIAVTTDPAKMTGYVEGDKIDLTGIVVTATLQEDGGSKTKTEDVTASSTFEVNGAAVTSQATPVSMAMNGKKVTAKYNGKTAETTATLEIAANEVTGIAIKTEPTKVEYDAGDTLTLDGFEVTVTYANGNTTDLTFANFGSTVTATVDGTAITAASKATKAMDGKAITVTANGKSATTTATLTVNAAAAPAPDAPALDVDLKTNNIIVTNTAAGLEYAIVKAGEAAPEDSAYAAYPEGGFANLDADTEYTVYVRTAASGETVASPAESANQKTLKNRITIKSKSGSDFGVMYTDADSFAAEDDVKTLMSKAGVTISRLNGFYSDQALSTALAYPFDITTDTTIYAKQKASSGGGGGGGGGWSTPVTSSLTLNQTEVSGHVGDTVTLKATLTGSTLAIKWESDDEKIATVDENGVVTFVAEGTATITATAGSLKATAAVSVVPEDVDVPTEESLIDEKFVKPYVYGYEDGTFGATREITRAEVVAMVSRMLKNPIDENKTYATSFTDVEEGAWYKNYIGFLAQYNIVEGYGDGTFAPTNKITRAEMTAILARAARFQLTGNAASYSDVADNHWAKAYIATMAEKNLVNGYPDGTFAPNNNITRAETVAILNRMLDDSTVVGSIVPADVDSSYWAYNDIVKAMNDRELR